MHGPMLVGQPTKIIGYSLLATIQCNCEQPGVLVLTWQQRAAGIQSTREACPSCGRQFAIEGLDQTPDGNLGFRLQMSAPHGELITQ